MSELLSPVSGSLSPGASESSLSPSSPMSPLTESEKMARKRNFVIAEIIDTEKAYLDRLMAVFDIFVEPLKRLNIVDGDEVRNQFGYWEVMLGTDTTYMPGAYKIIDFVDRYP
jgi:hypothetical protein